MAMSLEEFVGLLTPKQISFFSSAVRGGLALYADPSNYNPKVLLDHPKAVRAQIRNAHIIGEARRLIASDPGLGVHERTIKHRILFLVNAQAYVSFKRLDDTLRGRNYPTAQVKGFNNQSFPGMEGISSSGGEDDTGDIVLQPSLWTPSMLPDMINVWAGYKPDLTETHFDYYVICPDGDTNAWEWHLSENDIKELTTTTRPVETKAAKKARRRVLPRRGVGKKQANDESVG